MFPTAPACKCDRPMILGSDDHCDRCGHAVVVDADRGQHEDRWIDLLAMIERGRLALRDRARELGIDPDRDPDTYELWLRLYGEAYAPGIEVGGSHDTAAIGAPGLDASHARRYTLTAAA